MGEKGGNWERKARAHLHILQGPPFASYATVISVALGVVGQFCSAAFINRRCICA